jgi:hypothetical protein
MKKVTLYSAFENQDDLFSDFEEQVENVLESRGYIIETCRCNRNFKTPQIRISAYHPEKNLLFDVNATIDPHFDSWRRPVMRYLRMTLEL